jgi:hypothetical protein
MQQFVERKTLMYEILDAHFLTVFIIYAIFFPVLSLLNYLRFQRLQTKEAS